MKSLELSPVLVIEYPDHRVESWLINEDVLVLGRNQECNIVIRSELVSRKHLRIERKDNIWIIEDLESTNGTRVNGLTAKEPRILHDKDQIMLSNAIQLWFVEDFQKFLLLYGDDDGDTRPVQPVSGGASKVTDGDTLAPTDSVGFRSFNRPKNVPPLPIPLLNRPNQVKSTNIKETKVIEKLPSKTIFISYSRDDWWHYVLPVVDVLRKEKFDIWIDQELIQGGEDWLDTINKALSECSCLLLCVTPQSLQSRYVKMEYRYFLDKGKPIVPLICEKSELPAELMRIQNLSYGNFDGLLTVLQEKSKLHLGKI